MLLQWIARHIDQANKAEIWLAAHEQPETWLEDLQVKIETPDRAPMGRVLSIEKMDGMQVGEGRFTAQIVDRLCPWNIGRWQFSSVDGMLQVTPTSQAECSLDIQALAGLIYGTLDPADFALRGWGEPSPATQNIMRTMFPALQPYLHEFF